MLHAELLFLSRGDEISSSRFFFSAIVMLLFPLFRPLTAPVSLSVRAQALSISSSFFRCFSNSAWSASSRPELQAGATSSGVPFGSASVELLSTFTLGAISPSPPTWSASCRHCLALQHSFEQSDCCLRRFVRIGENIRRGSKH